MKRCTRCKELFPATREFFNSRYAGSTRHLRCWCKPCQREQRLERAADLADARATARVGQ